MQKIPNNTASPGFAQASAVPEVRTGLNVQLDNIAGARYGEFDTPRMGDIVINPVGATDFGFAAVIWEGSSTPTFTGHDKINITGEITGAGPHTVYLHWIDGQVNISFSSPVSTGGGLPDNFPPAPMTLLQAGPPGGSGSTPPGGPDTVAPAALSFLQTAPTIPDNSSTSALTLLQTNP